MGVDGADESRGEDRDRRRPRASSDTVEVLRFKAVGFDAGFDSRFAWLEGESDLVGAARQALERVGAGYA
jgi:hypothetical protein